MNGTKLPHWPQPVMKYRLMALFLIGSLVCVVSRSHAQIPAYGNLLKQEYGDAVYRELGVIAGFIAGDYNHTGVFGGLDESHKGKALQALGIGHTTEEVNFENEFTSYGNGYYGAYTLNNRTMTFTDRKRVVSTAVSLVGATIPYPSLPPNCIEYHPPNFDGTISDISAIRCDGFVEYCYEKNNFRVWRNQDYVESAWSIVEYPDLNNDLPDLTRNPENEASPWAQRGAPCATGPRGGFFGCSYLPPDTKMTQPSVINLPTYEITAVPGPGYVDVTIRATDESGIHLIGCVKPGESTWTYSPTQPQHPTSDSYSWTVQVTTSGRLYYAAVDNGGNAPSIAATPYVTINIGGSCSYTISPADSSSEKSGGIGNVNVTAGAGCDWSAMSGATWINVTSGNSGSGNGTVNYTVLPNTDANSRTGTITIAGQTFTITQAGTASSPPVSIAGKTILMGVTSGTPPFTSDNGYEIFIPSASGNSFQMVSIYDFAGHNISTSSGSYLYSATGPIGSLTLTFANDLAKGRLNFADATTGNCSITNVSLSPVLAYEAGDFEIYSGRAPPSLAGRIFNGTVIKGIFPFAVTGTFKVQFAVTGNSYTIEGDGVNTANSFGTYSFSKLNPSTMKVQLNDLANGPITSLLIFSTPLAACSIEMQTTSGAFQIADVTMVDSKPPTVGISSPVVGVRTTNSTLVAQGTSSDDADVQAVEYRVENGIGGGSYQLAAGTTNWSAQITDFAAGTNTIRVRARDTSGNLSAEATRTFTFVVVSPVTLSTNGSGRVIGATGDQLLEVAKAYKLIATPALRNLFVNWSGDLASTNPALTFLMQSNMTLQANFVTNPFVGLKGKFYDLFSETNDVRNQDRSGAFNLTLAEAGGFSASFQLGAKKLPVKGAFDWLGQSVLKLKPSLTETVTVALQLDVTNLNAWVTGTVSNGDWTAPLLGYRAPVYPVGSTSPQAGKYTLVIPGSDDAASSPGGDGYGMVTLSPLGALKLAGKLADGTLLSQSIPASADGWWALYSALYASKGSLHGWMLFTNQPDSDISGELSWIKPALATSKYYPLGFTNASDAVGAFYAAPLTANRVVNITSGTVEFLHGNLIQPITNNVLLTTNNKIINLSSNKLTMTFTLASGLFKGSVTDTNTSKSIPFTGALLQKLDTGYGHFLGTNQSGEVLLSPAP